MLIIGERNAIVYENICSFSILPKDEENNTVSIFAYMNNGMEVSLGTCKTEEEAQNVLKSIGSASKTAKVFNL